MDSDTSAFMTAAILTLMAAPWFMSFIPRCSHAECLAAHKEASAKELKANQANEVARLHAWHDRFRPQPTCVLCQTKRDDEP